MPCYHPLIRAVDKRGNQIFYSKEDRHVQTSIYEEANTVPCRQCYGCRVRKTIDWALRCTHELQAHKGVGVFLTLTYDNENIPSDGGLVKSHLRSFHDSLRKRIKPSNYKYFQCGEYGDKTNRPHYHLLLFGFDFPDKTLWSTNRMGHKYYRSKILEKSWKKGNCMIAELNYQTACYTARYCQKKITGDAAKEHYTRFDSDTGEIFEVLPEFHTQSNKPKGIGYSWLTKYLYDVFPSDEVVHDGKTFPVPRYYYDELEKINPDLRAQVEHSRSDARLYKKTYNSIERLAQIEKCKLAQAEKKLLDSEKII